MHLPPGHSSDLDLVTALQHPSSRERAFRDVLRAWQAPLYGHLRRMLGNHEDAADATKASTAEVRDLVESLAQQRKDMVDLESAYLLEVADLLGAERALMLPEMQRELARNIRERMGASGRKEPPGPRQGQSQRPARRLRLH